MPEEERKKAASTDLGEWIIVDFAESLKEYCCRWFVLSYLMKIKGHDSGKRRPGGASSKNFKVILIVIKFFFLFSQPSLTSAPAVCHCYKKRGTSTGRLAGQWPWLNLRLNVSHHRNFSRGLSVTLRPRGAASIITESDMGLPFCVLK